MKKTVVGTDQVVIGMDVDPSKDRRNGALSPALEEMADRDLGREAGLAGQPNDKPNEKSEAWQRGWAEGQE